MTATALLPGTLPVAEPGKRTFTIAAANSDSSDRLPRMRVTPDGFVFEATLS
jgi:hypothetical protein